MRVAVWDHLPESLFGAEPGRGDDDVAFVTIPAAEAADALSSGDVDVALLPTLTILQQSDEYDVFPAVALSSWDFPFARLFLSGDLGTRAGSLVVESGRALEALVARVVLREHYGSDVTVRTEPSRQPVRPAAGEEVSLVVAPEAYRIKSDQYSMDLGREWFELANYPMVWGLFATAKDRGTQEMIIMLRDAVIQADNLRPMRARAAEDEVVRDFLEHQVRLRLDDLAVASLTELCNYVYYYGAVTDYCTVPFLSLTEPGEEVEDGDGAT